MRGAGSARSTAGAVIRLPVMHAPRRAGPQHFYAYLKALCLNSTMEDRHASASAVAAPSNWSIGVDAIAVPRISANAQMPRVEL